MAQRVRCGPCQGSGQMALPCVLCKGNADCKKCYGTRTMYVKHGDCRGMGWVFPK